MVEPPIVALSRLFFSYPGGREVFRDLDFSVHAGERIGLYGPNGSGKTTLFRLLVGLEKPSAGQVLLRGGAVEGAAGLRVLRRTVGLVLQHADDQLFCPTVLEDVAFGPLHLGLKPAEARERSVETLNSLGLNGFEDRLVHKLSGGEKKLVSLAAVLSMRPDVILLDEPTNGLDPQAARRIADVLQALPCARVVISHDKEFLAETADTLMTVADGHICVGTEG